MPLRARVGRHTQQGRRHCQNWVDDQNHVIALLNRIPIADGGAEGTLDGRIGRRMVAGMASDGLYAAIMRFEDRHFPRQRSGFVDPRGMMLGRMEKLAASPPAWSSAPPPLPDRPTATPYETSLDRLRRNLLDEGGWKQFSAQERKDFEPLIDMALKHIDHLQTELGLRNLPWEVELFGRAYITRNKMPMLGKDGSITFIDMNDVDMREKLPLPQMRFGQPVDYQDGITTAHLGALLLYGHSGRCCRVPPFHEGKVLHLGPPLMRDPARMIRP